ncbi:MAG: DUF4197 domain-containing protein [Verrucomicrobia bacterium]|nr:DUF4197 domain-containing protein [Verrucomicrobiota bacterium]
MHGPPAGSVEFLISPPAISPALPGPADRQPPSRLGATQRMALDCPYSLRRLAFDQPPQPPKLTPHLMKFLSTLLLVTTLHHSAPAQFHLLDALKAKAGGTNALPSLATLTEDQTAKALKEALAQGAESAVKRLGTNGGFLTNLNVKIPMPASLQKVEQTLRKLKQGALADEFISTLNRAAEQAVPAAAPVFAESIRQLTVADAKAILTGPKDAATQYFRRTSTNALHAQFLPVVKQATDAAGVTAAYKAMLAQAGPAASLAQTFGGAFGKSLGLDAGPLDLDSYVTGKAIDGLFKLVAQEEQRIRENPAARTTDLLKQVFGAVKKQ